MSARAFRGVVAAVSIGAVFLAAAFAGSASASFGIASFSASYEDPSGEPLNVAGAHPDLVSELDFNTTDSGGTTLMDGSVRDIEIDLPAGFAGNPQAVPACSMEEIVVGFGFCNPAAQVGLFEIDGSPYPIYRLQAAPEQMMVLGAVVSGVAGRVVISPRTSGDFGLTARIANINGGLALTSTRLTLWGVPASSVHDPERWKSFGNRGQPAEIEPKPFLSLPTRCEPLATEIRADSWQNRGIWSSKTAHTPPLTDCEGLSFAPSLSARPTSNVAASPSGLDLDLTIPQSEDPDGRASAHLRDLKLTLPGLAINPSGADGLGACSPEQVGLTSTIASGSASFTATPPSCPDASKVGTAAIETPAFPDPLTGSVFVATPARNPFGGLLALYVVVEGRGAVIKLAAELSRDPRTGRIAIDLRESPQLPFEHLQLRLFGGSSAPLRTAATCGTYSTSSSLTPWSAPESGPPASPADTYSLSRGANGRDCVYSQLGLPSAVSITAGSISPVAGTYTPFVIDLRREDGTQQIASTSVTLPPGLLAKLAGTTTCADRALAVAAAKSGAGEREDPSCPPGSMVGSVYVSAGAGPAPFDASGKAYLAGPYKGAPLSLAIVTPAVAGPFDLGTVVVRAAVDVDLRTAQIHVASDPLPLIVAGIPLDVRSVSIRLDRPGFTRNPTSCDPMLVAASAVPELGAATAVASRFQLAECSRLGFRPRGSVRVSGGVARNAHPRIEVRIDARKAAANLAAATLRLPPGELLDIRNMGALCDRGLAPGQCPPTSRLGRARIWSPLLAEPLEGPIYLRAPNGRLPALSADLRGGGLRYELRGQTIARGGRLGIRLPDLPDIPLSKAVITLAGGPDGIFVNSESLCGRSRHATVDLSAHNSDQKRLYPLVRLPDSC